MDQFPYENPLKEADVTGALWGGRKLHMSSGTPLLSVICGELSPAPCQHLVVTWPGGWEIIPDSLLNTRNPAQGRWSWELTVSTWWVHVCMCPALNQVDLGGLLIIIPPHLRDTPQGTPCTALFLLSALPRINWGASALLKIPIRCRVGHIAV